MTEIINKIEALKKKKKAVIIAHNYQTLDVQDVADFVGDSLELSRQAARTDADMIIFCGVDFMAETAHILSPSKKVILPDRNAGCPMAGMATVQRLQTMKKAYPQAAVVAYVNSSAEIKANSDICCTSGNAAAVVNSLKNEEIIFLPDKYLGKYVSSKTDKKIIFWEGYCPTHVRILSEDIKNQKLQHPKAEVLVHPECTPEVTAAADRVLSTGGMMKYAAEGKKKEFIIGTEIGMVYTLKKKYPDKKFYPASLKAVCLNMKLTTLEKILWAIDKEIALVTVPEEIRVRARTAIDRMLEVKVSA